MAKFITFSNIKGDFLGGLTSGIVAIPLALAFGILAFGSVDDPAAIMMGAMAGLTGGIMLGFFASLFGGTGPLVSGPTAPMTLVTSVVAGMAYAKFGSLESAMVVIIISFVLCGLFQIIFGIIKLGKYLRFIPYPIVSGFMSGIGILLIILQIFPLFGLKSPPTVINVFSSIPSLASQMDVSALMMGLLTIAIILLFPLITKKIPSTLIALICVTVLAYFTGFDSGLTAGNMPSGFPEIRLGVFKGLNWEIFTMALIPGLILAGLGAIESILTSVTADNLTKTKHHGNLELIGQGIGNTIAGLFGGITGSGNSHLTHSNISSGGKTKLSGMIHSLLLLGFLLGLGSFVSYVPLSVFAGILITVGIGIIDFKWMKYLLKVPKADAAVLLIVLFLVVFVDLLQAIGIAMAIATVLFMIRSGEKVEKDISAKSAEIAKSEVLSEDEKEIISASQGKIHIQQLNGPLISSSVNCFQEAIYSIPDNAQIVIISTKEVGFIDQSGLFSLETIVKNLNETGKIILISDIQPQVRHMFEKTAMIPGLIPETRIFKTFADCTVWLKKHFKF